MKYSKPSRCASILMFTAICWLLTPDARAADSIGILSAGYIPPSAPDAAHVVVVFESKFGTPGSVELALDKSHYRIVDLGDGTLPPPGQPPVPPVTVTSVTIETVQGLPREEWESVLLSLSAPLTVAPNRYVVIVSKLKFGDDQVDVDTAPAVIDFSSNPKLRTKPRWTASKDRDDSDLYLAGSISNSKSENYYGSTDIKIRVPLLMPKPHNRTVFLSPMLDIQTSASPDGDPDSIDMGFSFLWFPATLVQWEIVPELESTKDFGITDGVVRSDFVWFPHSFKRGKSQLWINPLVGIAVGRILHVPDDVTDLKKGPIARVIGGASATLKFPVFFAKSATITGTYELRHLTKGEPTEADTLSAGNHHWATLKGEIAINDFFGLAVTGQDGQQPPKFKAVNREVTVDLVFKAKRINKQATN